MHRLIHTQPFVIRPRINRSLFHPRHLRRQISRFEANEFRLALRLHSLHQVRQWESGPRHSHRPTLHAAETVQPLLKRKRRQNFIHIPSARLIHQPTHFNRPWLSHKLADSILHRLLIGRMEFVVVVVSRGRPFLGYRNVQLVLRIRFRGIVGRGRGAEACDRRNGSQTCGFHQLAAVHVDALRGGVALWDFPAFRNSNQHGGIFLSL